MKRAASQRFSRPLRQYATASRTVQPSQGTPTRDAGGEAARALSSTSATSSGHRGRAAASVASARRRRRGGRCGRPAGEHAQPRLPMASGLRVTRTRPCRSTGRARGVRGTVALIGATLAGRPRRLLAHGAEHAGQEHVLSSAVPSQRGRRGKPQREQGVRGPAGTRCRTSVPGTGACQGGACRVRADSSTGGECHVGCRHARPARLPRRVPDPRAHDVPHQPFARGDAAQGRGAARRVRAHVARAGDPRVGRGLVGDADGRRRPGRAHRRRAGRLDGDAPERGGRRGGRALLLPPDRPGRETGSSTSGANFPSVRYLYQAQPDLEVVVCEDEEAIVDAIDERTLLVPISHVLFKTAEIQDVGPIVRRAHEVGAHVILDCYQSAGIVPVDVTALGVDFAVGGSVKWLCGGPGNGWLYVRPDLAERLEADVHRVAGPRAAVRLRGGDALRARGGALPDRHAQRPGALRRHGRLRPDRGDRRRPHPRELAPADAAADRPRRRGRLRDPQPPGSGPPRRHGDGARARLRRACIAS